MGAFFFNEGSRNRKRRPCNGCDRFAYSFECELNTRSGCGCGGRGVLHKNLTTE